MPHNEAKRANYENWLSPTNKLVIREAVRKHASEMELRDGRKFKLTYQTEPIGKTYAGEELVTISPTGGALSPRGQFKVATVLDLMWLAFAGDRKDL